MHDVRLDIGGIRHGSNVAYTDWIPLRVDLDDDILNRVDGFKLIVREHVVVEVAGFDITGRQNQVGGLDGLHDVKN